MKKDKENRNSSDPARRELLRKAGKAVYVAPVLTMISLKAEAAPPFPSDARPGSGRPPGPQ